MLVATRNAGKVAEIAAITAPLGYRVLSAADVPGLPEVDETGMTFSENARLKALSAAAHAGVLTLADDSGLEVDALGGRPGVYSARFAGEGATDEANNARLLDELRGVPPERRGARYVCVIALAAPDGAGGAQVLGEFRGELEGRIADGPRGAGGFGYDPLMELPELGRTVAELSMAEKNEISHRARALRQALAWLRDYRSEARAPASAAHPRVGRRPV